MAVHVEDHPIEYFDFEGVIPAKQYGAGDVIVWDWGTWEPEAETPNPAAAIAKGELKFRLRGEKLGGRFTIVRTSGRKTGLRPFENDESEQWLLILTRRGGRRLGRRGHPASVKTGRTTTRSRSPAMPTGSERRRPRPRSTCRRPNSDQPARFHRPMLARCPIGRSTIRWLFEIKWDGYRVQAIVADGEVRIHTRNGHDAATYFPRLIAPPARWLAAEEAVIDGEVVALGPDGRPDFSLLQARISQSTGGRVPGMYGRGSRSPEGGSPDAAADDVDASNAPLVYQVFDLLRHDGRSLLKVPLEERKRLLRAVIKDGSSVRFAAHVVGEGSAFYRAAAAQGLEGIVAKHRRSRYEPGRRTSAWLKLKLRPEQALRRRWTPGEGTRGSARSSSGSWTTVACGSRGRSARVRRTRPASAPRTPRRWRRRHPFDPSPGTRPDLGASTGSSRSS
jgi:bifunctional non-homologous end joining protein LigD